VSTLHVVSIHSSETSANFYQTTVPEIFLQTATLRTALEKGSVEWKQFHIASRMRAMQYVLSDTCLRYVIHNGRSHVEVGH
jgi:hypothetical protein